MDTHSKKFKSILRLAKTQTELSAVEDFKMGAVIFDNHKVYACACNTWKSTPMQVYYNRFKKPNTHAWRHSGHAEINCLHKLLQQYYNRLPDMKKLSILVYREYADGSLAMARPCPACEAALKELGIKNIYYTGKHSLIYEEYCLSDLKKPFDP